jgi:pyridoxine 5-phosphate synthase
MRRLTLALDALPSLREATRAYDVDVAAAATLAELAGADAVRIGIHDEQKPVQEADVHEARRASRTLELRMPPSPAMVKIALEARPDRVLLAAAGPDGRSPAGPLDLRERPGVLASLVRTLGEAGIPTEALIAPDLDAVKRARAEGVSGVEFFTAAIVDLPANERRVELERLGDAVRLASKLQLTIGVGGGLGYRTLRDVLDAVPAAGRVAVGRAALARAVLVGLDRAVRDLRALIG